MTCSEYEISYIFSEHDAYQFLKKLKASNCVDIDDYYLDRDTRIRVERGYSSDCTTRYILTKKFGDKSDGCRLEQEEFLSEKVSDILISQSKLHVRKKRIYISVPTSASMFTFSIDLIEEPMKLAAFEIESKYGPVPTTLINEFLKVHGPVQFKSCPISAWDLFNRKIGICGAPSSGKSETAKWLSHTINTKLSGNSFHVVEFATSFIQKYGRTPSFADQFFIWHGQKSREENAKNANIIISDCPTFLTYIYMQILNKGSLSEQSALYLSKVYKRVLFDTLGYADMIFLQLQDYKENNVRYQTKSEALNIQRRIESFLSDHSIKHSKYTYHQANEILNDLFYINEID